MEVAMRWLCVDARSFGHRRRLDRLAKPSEQTALQTGSDGSVLNGTKRCQVDPLDADADLGGARVGGYGVGLRLELRLAQVSRRRSASIEARD